ncbi:uncharacterized protein LOC142768732 [Rhipicephalus microplus]|uniref:uncharacterized protein LOC142768732 n=1 Tax=Rhipicephalus microplus TaxID=6941 RepID=UPI003F6B56F9
MIDLFCQYTKGDKIGLIANAHLVWADLLDAGINSRRCRNQARKCSVNLDFAKCGDLKGLQNSEKPPMYPDFMEKQGAKNTYCSRKVMGQLYRNCTKVRDEDSGAAEVVPHRQRERSPLRCGVQVQHVLAREERPHGRVYGSREPSGTRDSQDARGILLPHCQPTAGELEGLGVVPGHVRAAGVRGRHSEVSVGRA